MSVAISPDGTSIVTGSADKTAKVWDARSGTFLLGLKPHAGAVNGVAFSPDGRHIVTASGAFDEPGQVQVWDSQTGVKVQDLKGHSNSRERRGF